MAHVNNVCIVCVCVCVCVRARVLACPPTYGGAGTARSKPVGGLKVAERWVMFRVSGVELLENNSENRTAFSVSSFSLLK